MSSRNVFNELCFKITRISSNKFQQPKEISGSLVPWYYYSENLLIAKCFSPSQPARTASLSECLGRRLRARITCHDFFIPPYHSFLLFYKSVCQDLESADYVHLYCKDQCTYSLPVLTTENIIYSNTVSLKSY